VADFWQTYFADSITKFSGYNIVNTVVYFAILFVAAFLVIFPLLNKRGIKFDFRFAIAVLGFVFLGSSARILEDLRLVQRSANPLEIGFYALSPGIYIAIGLYAIAALFFSLWAAKRFRADFTTVFAAIGYLSALPFVIFDFLRFTELAGFFLSLGFATVLLAVCWFCIRLWKPEIVKNKLNLLAIAGQALEGSSIFVATQFYSCGQSHGFSNIILGTAPLLFPMIKVALMAAIVYSLDTEIKNENLRGYIKLVLIILGFAMGTRNALTLGAGTCSAYSMAGH